MEAIKNKGQIERLSRTGVIWRIPNFYDLPQTYDTVIRSPRFTKNCIDWYMEVYPNGRRLYSSLGWFGISVLNLNSEYPIRNVLIGVTISANRIFSNEKSHGHGFYCCTRLIPTSLFNSWKEIFAPEGDLRLIFNIPNKDKLPVDTIFFNLRADDVQKLFHIKFENACVEASVQAEERKELTMKTFVGEVRTGSEIMWNIPNFSDLPHRYDTVIRSPLFIYKDKLWSIEVYPNGRSLFSSLGWFGIGFRSSNSDSTLPCTTVRFFNETCEIDVRLKEDSQNEGLRSCSKLLPTSLLKSWQDVIAPGGNLELFFFIDDEDDDDDNDTVNRIHMRILKETMERWYQQKCENADTFIEASTQTEEEIVKEELKQTDGSASTESDKGLEKMRQDFQEILLKENISDIVLRVKSHEFKAHRCILAARSPVFLAMMTHDTKEKNTGVVDIPDGDPNVFPDFLKYMYTGSVSNLTSENAANLYTLADKYQVNYLKESCKDHMMTNISVDNFCDVFTLSLQHDEKELKDACIHFFARNSLDIIVTCKWQIFISENPITGNELFIQHLQLNKCK